MHFHPNGEIEMKTTVTLLALAWLASGVAFAADSTTATTTPPARVAPGPDMDRMALLLDLDSYQKTEVEKILKEQHEQMRADFDAARASGTRPTRDEMKAKREQSKQELNTKLSAVLNETQMKKFEALHERGPGPGRGFNKRGWDGKGKDNSTNSSCN
jgi:Spy/CpxP family protein refolding chaperone